MDKYLGIKLIEATPAYRITMDYGFGDIDTKVLTSIPDDVCDKDKVEEGYKIVYPSGYEGWCPKDIFEKAYLKLTPNPQLKSGISISKDMVKDFVKETHVTTLGDKTTVVRAVLVNGFEIVESSSCVDKENYSIKMGEEICMEKIYDKIWGFLGFLLQTGVGGVK